MRVEKKVSNMDKIATHYLKCYQHVGNNKKKLIFHECYIIAFCEKNNMMRVFITKSNGCGEGKMRYAKKENLIEMYENI